MRKAVKGENVKGFFEREIGREICLKKLKDGVLI
jgi:hypothetical protein